MPAIESIEKHGTFIRAGISGSPGGFALMAGRYVYYMKNKPLADGCAKPGAYVDGGKPDARFARNGFMNSPRLTMPCIQRNCRVSASLYL